MYSYLLHWLLWTYLKCMHFHEKKRFFPKNLKFSNFEIFFEKSWIFKKIIKFQIALKTSLFELWTNQKTATRFFDKLYIHKKIAERILARAAHAKSHFVLKTQKSSKFGPEGRIFYGRARGSARAPNFFFTIVFFIKFCISQIPWMYSYLLNWLL